MKYEHCDVLVVGLGPAGSSAARAAADLGARVLAVELRPVVGIPVRCAEYVPKALIGMLDLAPSYVVQQVLGMRTFLPGGREAVTPAPGCMIRRDQFDQALAADARRIGAHLSLGTRVLRRENDEVVLAGADKREYRVRPKVIVGADGPRSLVGRWIGAENRNLLPGVQACMDLVRPLDHTEVFFDPAVYAGYAWLFPKNGEANVGLAVRGNKARVGNLGAMLHSFIDRLRVQGKVCGEPKNHTAGWIPAEPVRRAVCGNVLLAGDAAGQTHPITGAGIYAACVCGRMAGEWAAYAALDQDLTLLEEYETEWRELFEESLTRAWSRRRAMETDWDSFETIIPSCWVAFRDYYSAAV